MACHSDDGVFVFVLCNFYCGDHLISKFVERGEAFFATRFHLVEQPFLGVTAATNTSNKFAVNLLIAPYY